MCMGAVGNQTETERVNCCCIYNQAPETWPPLLTIFSSFHVLINAWNYSQRNRVSN